MTNQASEDDLRTLDEILSQAFTDGASDTMWQDDKHVETFATAKKEILAIIQQETAKAIKNYEDDLLSTLDDISNKPWRAIRHIREMYENSAKKDTEWYKEVARDYALLEEFYSNGGSHTIEKLLANPKFNVNFPERIAELSKTPKELEAEL